MTGQIQFTLARELCEYEPEPVEFYVQDFLPRKGLVLLYGPSSVGKTYLGLQLATEMRRAQSGDGGFLFSHPELHIVHPWRVVLWISTEETGAQLRERWDKVRAGLGGIGPTQGLLFKWGSDPGERVTLDQLGKILEVQDTARQLPQVLVLDSLTALAPDNGTEWEADNFAVRRLCAKLRAWAEQYSLLIILVHHTGKVEARGARGASEWRNAVDTMIRLTGKGKNSVELAVEKQRHGRKRDSFLLRCEWSNGEFRAVAAAVGATSREETEAKRKVRECLTSHGKISQAKIKNETGMARSTVQTKLKELLEDGVARLTGDMEERSPVYELIEPTAAAMDEAIGLDDRGLGPACEGKLPSRARRRGAR